MTTMETSRTKANPKERDAILERAHELIKQRGEYNGACYMHRQVKEALIDLLAETMRAQRPTSTSISTAVPTRQCDDCGGSGSRERPAFDSNSGEVTNGVTLAVVACARCDGSGRVIST